MKYLLSIYSHGPYVICAFVIDKESIMKNEMLIRISDFLYEVPVSYKKGMKVPARIYADEKLISTMDEAVLDQITNVCMLPGIVNYGICMPDGHSGYGFPIGGVAAIDPDGGVISPGGIGFDINCGVRLLATNLTADEVKPRMKEVVDGLFSRIPTGVGGKGLVRLSDAQFDRAMTGGMRWAAEQGYAVDEDLLYAEEGGAVSGADPAAVSARARERGRGQIGSLGSGNHFLELQQVSRDGIYDRETARVFGIDREDQVLVMIHTGSRGFGHQVASDYLRTFSSVMGKVYGLTMPDRELACAPFYSRHGQDYFGAMNCAINIAFLNRQLITHAVRSVFSRVFGRCAGDHGMRLVYDVCHNTAKLEQHMVNGREKTLLVHRKGATRAFAAGMKGIPEKYMNTGQPVIIGGSMDSGSYLLAGEVSGGDAFYTTAHGSGRVMSRTRAKKSFNGRELQERMLRRGIYVKTASLAGLAEEAGAAYKKVDEVVRATEKAGLSRRIARLEPMGNIKG